MTSEWRFSLRNQPVATTTTTTVRRPPWNSSFFLFPLVGCRKKRRIRKVGLVPDGSHQLIPPQSKAQQDSSESPIRRRRPLLFHVICWPPLRGVCVGCWNFFLFFLCLFHGEMDMATSGRVGWDPPFSCMQTTVLLFSFWLLCISEKKKLGYGVRTVRPYSFHM